MDTTNVRVPAGLANQLQTELQNRHNLSVKQEWLTTFLSTVKSPPPPFQALLSTTYFRLLNSNFTQTLSATNTSSSAVTVPASSSSSSSAAAIEIYDTDFDSDDNDNYDHNDNTTFQPQTQIQAQPQVLPKDITSVERKSTTLQTNIPVQILTISDVGSSKWSQLEAIERFERGEDVRGREVIRNVPVIEEGGDHSSSSTSTSVSTSISHQNRNQSTTTTIKKSQGPHKLLLEDAQGTKISAFELQPIPKIFITNTPEEGGMNIGCKLMLRKGCIVRRGMVMLRPEHVVVLGGKVDGWDVVWRRERKKRLTTELEGTNQSPQQEQQGQQQEEDDDGIE